MHPKPFGLQNSTTIGLHQYTNANRTGLTIGAALTIYYSACALRDCDRRMAHGVVLVLLWQMASSASRIAFPLRCVPLRTASS